MDDPTGELDYQIEKRGGFRGLPALAVTAVLVLIAVLRVSGRL